MGITHYKDLIVWQKSMLLVTCIYAITKNLPNTENFGLCSQMQRAAVSIPSNIAEGHVRSYKKEFVRFLGIAYGSSAELETQIIIAKNQYGNIDFSEVESILIEIQKMLMAIIKKLKQNDNDN